MSPWRRFWLKLTRFEYWPFYIFYIPVEAYYLWLALKNWCFGFIVSSNPSMYFGGFTGESKAKIYDLIPKEYLPETKLFNAGDLQAATQFVAQLGFPLIAKPDKGERGKLVEKLSSIEELEAYIRKCPVDFLLQELITLPVELGIFYMRHPDEAKGGITSIVQKEFLGVIGNGYDAVRELLAQNERARLQIDFDHPRFESIMSQVPDEGEKILVESIGNHCRGTIFLDRCELIDEELTAAIDELSKRISGFYYGRFDLRCASVDALKKLQNFKIIELNGAGAEPAHIYQPGYSLWKAYGVVFWHFKQLSRISAANRRKGVPQWGLKKGISALMDVRRYNQQLKQF